MAEATPAKARIQRHHLIDIRSARGTGIATCESLPSGHGMLTVTGRVWREWDTARRLPAERS